MPAFFLVFATRLLTFIGGLGTGLSGLITTAGLGFIAFKAFMLFLAVIVLPLVLYNLSVFMMSKAMEIAFSMVSTSSVPGSSPVVQLTGMAGYIANEIYLKQALSMIFAATSVRFALGFIPGFGK